MNHTHEDLTPVPLGVFGAALHAYHDLAHLLTDEEADLLHILIDSYISRDRILKATLESVKTIIARIWQQS